MPPRCGRPMKRGGVCGRRAGHPDCCRNIKRERYCLDCGVDVSSRGTRVERCEVCAGERNRARNSAATRKWQCENRALVNERRRAWNAANRDKVSELNRKTNAKWGPIYAARFKERRARLIEDQGGLCPCGEALFLEGSVIDHNHECCDKPPQYSCQACDRGAMHNICNRAMGMLGDDPVRLRLLADYLDSKQ